TSSALGPADSATTAHPRSRPPRSARGARPLAWAPILRRARAARPRRSEPPRAAARRSAASRRPGGACGARSPGCARWIERPNTLSLPTSDDVCRQPTARVEEAPMFGQAARWSVPVVIGVLAIGGALAQESKDRESGWRAHHDAGWAAY